MLSEGTSIALDCALLNLGDPRSLTLMAVQPVRFAGINTGAAVLLIANVLLGPHLPVNIVFALVHHWFFLAVFPSAHHAFTVAIFLILVVVVVAQI